MIYKNEGVQYSKPTHSYTLHIHIHVYIPVYVHVYEEGEKDQTCGRKVKFCDGGMGREAVRFSQLSSKSLKITGGAVFCALHAAT